MCYMFIINMAMYGYVVLNNSLHMIHCSKFLETLRRQRDPSWDVETKNPGKKPSRASSFRMHHVGRKLRFHGFTMCWLCKTWYVHCMCLLLYIYGSCFLFLRRRRYQQLSSFSCFLPTVLLIFDWWFRHWALNVYGADFFLGAFNGWHIILRWW